MFSTAKSTLLSPPLHGNYYSDEEKSSYGVKLCINIIPLRSQRALLLLVLLKMLLHLTSAVSVYCRSHGTFLSYSTVEGCCAADTVTLLHVLELVFKAVSGHSCKTAQQ